MLALSPVIITFILVVFCGLNASAGMGLVTACLFLVLRFTNREVGLKDVVIGALDIKMFLNVLCILYFIQILTVTHVLQEIVAAFQSSPLPVPVIIACVSFIIGVLTGMSQGHVAIVMPIVAAMQTGSLNLAGVAMASVLPVRCSHRRICALLSPSIISKPTFLKRFKPVLLCEIIILTLFTAYTYFTW